VGGERAGLAVAYERVKKRGAGRKEERSGKFACQREEEKGNRREGRGGSRGIDRQRHNRSRVVARETGRAVGRGRKRGMR